MNAHPESNKWDTAAVLRLKYLYESNSDEDLLRNCEVYLDDDRSRKSYAELLYMSWLAQVRLGQTDAAKELEKRFRNLYPGHYLGANICFEAFKSSLLQGEYTEAEHYLRVIADQYGETEIKRRIDEHCTSLDAGSVNWHEAIWQSSED